MRGWRTIPVCVAVLAIAGAATDATNSARSPTVREYPVPAGSRPHDVAPAPHGVIVGPDGAPWITDGGLNAIVRVDPKTRRVRTFPLPASSGDANLNTASFDRRGVLWFTGQNGIYGRLDPRSGEMKVFAAP